jgi:hypothetical protein
MVKKPFHSLILEKIEEKIPCVRSDQASEDEAKMLCDILSGALINDKVTKFSINCKLEELAKKLISHDEQGMKYYLLETREKILAN